MILEIQTVTQLNPYFNSWDPMLQTKYLLLYIVNKYIKKVFETPTVIRLCI